MPVWKHNQLKSEKYVSTRDKQLYYSRFWIYQHNWNTHIQKNSKISLINMLGPQKGNKQIPKRNLIKYKEMGKWIEKKKVQDLKVEIESTKET